MIWDDLEEIQKQKEGGVHEQQERAQKWDYILGHGASMPEYPTYCANGLTLHSREKYKSGLCHNKCNVSLLLHMLFFRPKPSFFQETNSLTVIVEICYAVWLHSHFTHRKILISPNMQKSHPMPHSYVHSVIDSFSASI